MRRILVPIAALPLAGCEAPREAILLWCLAGAAAVIAIGSLVRWARDARTRR